MKNNMMSTHNKPKHRFIEIVSYLSIWIDSKLVWMDS